MASRPAWSPASRASRCRRQRPPTARPWARALGRLHVASATYRTRLTNRRGPAWWRQAARAVQPFLDAGAARTARRRAQVPHGLRPRCAAQRRDPRRSLLRQRAVFRYQGVGNHRFRLRRHRLPRLRSRDRRQRLVHRQGRRAARGRSFPSSSPRWPAPTTRCGRSPPTNARSGRRCCAPRRCASGCRASTICTSRAPAELTHAHDPALFERILRDRAGTAPRFPDPDTTAGEGPRR